MKEDSLILTQRGLALKLQVTTRMIRKYQAKGMPAFYIGDLPRYEFEEVIKWLKSKKKGR